MTAAELVTPVSLALLVAMAIAAGLKVKVKDVIGAFRRTRQMILGLVLNFVVIPAVAIGLIQVLNAPPLVAAGVLIMAVCPGAPFALPGTAVARGDVPFAVGLMVANVVLSVALAPLLLGFLLGGIPGAENLKIDYTKGIPNAQFPPLLLPGCRPSPPSGRRTTRGLPANRRATPIRSRSAKSDQIVQNASSRERPRTIGASLCLQMVTCWLWLLGPARLRSGMWQPARKCMNLKALYRAYGRPMARFWRSACRTRLRSGIRIRPRWCGP